MTKLLNYHYTESTLENIELLNIENLQKYNPIYKLYFKLGENNYNKITLNQHYNVSKILEKQSFSKYLCKINRNEHVQEKETFVKFAPILDPIKYMVGKYDTDDENIFKLPK